MFESGAKWAFIVACACNAAFAVLGTHTADSSLIALLGGGAAFVVASALGVGILLASGLHHTWIKCALVFLALGPAAFWSLQWPATSALACLDCSINSAAYVRSLGDVMQSKLVMIALALAALFCAARAATSTLKELVA